MNDNPLLNALLIGRELLFNRYRVWKFIPRDDLKLIRLLLKPVFSFRIKIPVKNAIKWIIPNRYHPGIRKLKEKLLRTQNPEAKVIP